MSSVNTEFNPSDIVHAFYESRHHATTDNREILLLQSGLVMVHWHLKNNKDPWQDKWCDSFMAFRK